MVRSSVLASLLVTAAAIITGTNAELQNGDAVPGSFILEYVTNSNSGLIDAVLDPVQSLLNLDIGIHIDLQYDYDIFRGALISLDPQDDIDGLMSQLLSLGTIKSIWPNRIVRNIPFGGFTPLGSLPLSSASKSNPLSSLLGGDPSRKSRRDESSQPGVFSTHIATQVDLLHAKGIYGNGTRIAILDSGVDYSLEALGGCFGLGCLISFGRDYVGDSYSYYNPIPVPDPDPFTQCNGHGTHVTGIIAAQPDNKFGLLGAAPGATIGMYRVVGCDGTAYFDVIMKAALDAFQDGANILTASISVESGWKDDVVTTVFDRIARAGVIVTTSGGNTGDTGLFAPRTPNQGPHVSAIASFTNPVTPEFGMFTNYSVDGGDPVELYWVPGSPDAWPSIKLPIYFPTLNRTAYNFGCEYPDSTPDLFNYIVVVRATLGCYADEQAKAAVAKGAKYMLFASGWYIGPDNFAVNASIGIVAAAGITNEQLDTWIDLVAANKSVIVAMDDSKVVGYDVRYKPSPLAGYPDFFSTWGPTYEMDIKPQFGTPGGAILSLWPKKLDPSGFGYVILSGTSMSAPLAAAIYALVAQVRRTFDPATLQHVISATARAGPYSSAETYYEAEHGYTFPLLSPVPKQGTGMMQAYNAAYTTVVLSRTNIAFNDTANLDPNANFTIKNLGSEDINFTLGHSGAATAYTFNNGESQPATYQEIKVTDEYATITFAESQVTVPAGGEAIVSLTVTPPALNGRLYPVYSGYITGNSTNGENFVMPYQGLVGNLNEVPIFADAFLSNSSDSERKPIKSGTVAFVLPKDGCVDCTNFTVPVASIIPSFGTRILDVKLLDWETGNKLGSIKTPDDYPVYDVPRDDPFNSVWNGTMHDNSTAAAGTYVFEFSALKIYGDPSKDASFQRKRSVPFSISYA